MSTAVVSNTLHDASGAPVVGTVVLIELYPPSVRAFDPSGNAVVRGVTVETDSTGKWSVALERTDTMTPAGMLYTVHETVEPDPGAAYITVPFGGGLLRDLWTTPAVLDSVQPMPILERFVFPFSYETTTLKTGMPIITLQAYDEILVAEIRVFSAFNGTTPQGHLYFRLPGASPAGPSSSTDLLTDFNMTAVDQVNTSASGGTNSILEAGNTIANLATGYASQSLNMYFLVDNGAGGDPGAITQGLGEISITILHTHGS